MRPFAKLLWILVLLFVSRQRHVISVESAEPIAMRPDATAVCYLFATCMPDSRRLVSISHVKTLSYHVFSRIEIFVAAMIVLRRVASEADTLWGWSAGLLKTTRCNTLQFVSVDQFRSGFRLYDKRLQLTLESRSTNVRDE